MGAVVKKVLDIIDNPGGLPLDADTSWIPGLIQDKRPGDKLLLLGFTDAELITLRRRLHSVFDEAEILSFSTQARDALAAQAPGLVPLAIRGMLAGVDVDSHRYRLHADQPAADMGLDALLASSDPELPASRPRLAFISPLPPEATGIADYSAELLPYLAAHYEITLVVSQPVVEAALVERFAVMEPEAFRACSHEFDRILYQVGNSPYHAFQFDLLRDHPGTVVLHDIYLFDAVWWLADSGLWPDGLRQRLFQDHGYPAVLALDAYAQRDSQGGRGPEEYPVNGFVTQEAAGLIYHSHFAESLDRHWRVEAWQEPAAVIPHLRELPTLASAGERRDKRRALGIDDDACLIASFGGINPKKLTDRLVEAFLEGDWSQQDDVYLILVGAQHSGAFGQQLERRLREHPRGKRVRVTGYVDRQEYLDWLQVVDIAVQLRQQSRGESSGAILDAMAHGLAVVANAHGSSAELPAEAMAMLPDAIDAEALSTILGELVTRPDARRDKGRLARDWVATHLDPPSVAMAYRDAIERFAKQSRRQRREAWLDDLALLPGLADKSADDLAAVTRALSDVDSLAPQGAPRLLFDVSTIAWHDLKTGIERVTRRLADHLLRHPPAGWRVELIRWGGEDFHLARGFASDQLGIPSPGPDRPYQPRPGDVYISVEWAPPLLEQAGEALKRLRANGVRCYFTVHDLLPLHLPDCFPADVPITMRRWFTAIAELADGITCVSATVAEDVRQHLHQLSLDEAQHPWVDYFHLGADFAGRGEPQPLSAREQRLLATLAALDGATLLMVGTMEPRKGHQQVVDALTLCWQRRVPLNLIIIGKQGWQVDELVRQLKQHPQRQQRLFWLDGVSDALLKRLYQQGDALVAASLGEGFGLPLIEAAQHGLGIIARDIPVFREVAGPYADYFRGDTGEALAEELIAWFERWQQGQQPHSQGMPFNHWSQSAEQWLAPILADLPTCPAPSQPGETA